MIHTSAYWYSGKPFISVLTSTDQYTYAVGLYFTQGHSSSLHQLNTGLQWLLAPLLLWIVSFRVSEGYLGRIHLMFFPQWLWYVIFETLWATSRYPGCRWKMKFCSSWPRHDGSGCRFFHCFCAGQSEKPPDRQQPDSPCIHSNQWFLSLRVESSFTPNHWHSATLRCNAECKGIEPPNAFARCVIRPELSGRTGTV